MITTLLICSELSRLHVQSPLFHTPRATAVIRINDTVNSWDVFHCRSRRLDYGLLVSPYNLLIFSLFELFSSLKHTGKKSCFCYSVQRIKTTLFSKKTKARKDFEMELNQDTITDISNSFTRNVWHFSVLINYLTCSFFFEIRLDFLFAVFCLSNPISCSSLWWISSLHLWFQNSQYKMTSQCRRSTSLLQQARVQ